MKTRNVKKVWVLLLTCLITLIFTMPATGEEVAKKKIVFLKDDDGDFFNAVAGLIGNLFEKKGYTKENSEYVVLSMGGDLKNIPKVIEDVKKIKPDVMLMNGAFGLKEIAAGLKDTNIPIVLGINIDAKENGEYLYIDKNETPKANVTGLHSLLKDYEKNIFKLMNIIAPIQDKKVVMIMPHLWDSLKPNFVDTLKEMKIPLKKYESPQYWEDAQKLLLKYNKDKSVGWIIMDDAFEFKNPKNAIDKDKKHRWIADNNKRPGFAMYQNGIEAGQLCGIAQDSMATVGVMMDMADRLLKGANIKDVKAEYPPKSLLLLNQATATKLGFVFPKEIIDAAWRVYLDYEGNYAGKKDRN